MAAQRNAFGLQIADAIVKAAAVAKAPDGYSLTAYGQQPLAGGLIDQGLILNPKGVAQAVRHIIDHPAWGAFTTNHVVCSLPESRVFLKAITVPQYKGRDQSEMILWEAQSIVPIPKEKAYYYWQIIGTAGSKLEVLICAAEKHHVDQLVEVNRLAGLIPVAFDLECYATTRTIAQQALLGRTLMQVHIGLITTTLTVVRNGSIWFNSVIKIATRDFISEIAEGKQVPFAQAESDFYKLGLSRTSPERSFKELVNGITAAINFHNTRTEGEREKISQVFLSGSNATVPGLADKFVQSLPFDVKIAPPRFTLKIPKSGQRMSPLLTVVGSAVRAIEDDHGREMNLLPAYIVDSIETMSVRTLARNFLWVFLYVFVAALIILAATAAVVEQNKRQVAGEIKKQQEQIEKAEAKKLYPWVADTNKLFDQIIKFEASHLNAALVLETISKALPETTVLTNIKYTSRSRQWELEGIAKDRIEVLKIEESLKKITNIEKVRLPLSSLSDYQPAEFKIYFILKEEKDEKTKK